MALLIAARDRGCERGGLGEHTRHRVDQRHAALAGRVIAVGDVESTEFVGLQHGISELAYVLAHHRPPHDAETVRRAARGCAPVAGLGRAAARLVWGWR